MTMELEPSGAVEELGGVPGFVSHYGFTVVNFVRAGKSPQEALPMALEESRKYALDEWRKDIASFLNVYSSVYVGISDPLALSPPGYSTSINILKPWKRQASFVHQKEDWVEDPLLREAVEKFAISARVR